MTVDLFHPWPFGSIPVGQAGCVLADPPWTFRNWSKAGEKKNPSAHYDCMPLRDIMGLPVADLCKPDAVCLVWATAPLLDKAIDTLKAWGFTFKTAGSWAKQSSTGRSWAFGPGYIYRSASEFWIVGTKGDPRPLNRRTRNLIVAPVREHSRKPEAIRIDAESQWQGPFVELFARSERPGWLSWGNETTKFPPPEDGHAAE